MDGAGKIVVLNVPDAVGPALPAGRFSAEQAADVIGPGHGAVGITVLDGDARGVGCGRVSAADNPARVGAGGADRPVERAVPHAAVPHRLPLNPDQAADIVLSPDVRGADAVFNRPVESARE